MAQYTIVAIIDGYKEATLAGATKLIENVIKSEDDFPVQVEFPTTMGKWSAMKRSWDLDQKGIFNITLKKD